MSVTVRYEKLVRKYLNTSGDTLTAGDLVVFDTSNITKEGVKYATTIGQSLLAGVVSETAFKDQPVYVLALGVSNIKVDNSNGNIIAGDALISKASSGIAVKYTPSNIRSVVGIALEAYSSSTAGYIKANIVSVYGDAAAGAVLTDIAQTTSISFTIGASTSNASTTNFTHYFGNQVGNAYLRWNGTDQRFELSSSLSITGDLAVSGNISFTDSETFFQDDGDTSKKLQFQLSGISASTTRTVTWQDASGTVYITGGTDVAVADGGTGLSTIASGKLIYASALDTFSALTVGTTLSITAATLDIISTYPGQTSIVTLGTITTGTWSGTTIGISKGGTGLTSTPTNGQLLIGNGAGYTLSTLTGTASQIKIDNASGSITLSFFDDESIVTSLTVPTIYGGSAANDDITIKGTSHATTTTSYVILQPSGGSVGIGTTTPQTKLEVVSAVDVLGDGQSNIISRDSTSMASGVGGGISFMGYDVSTSDSKIFAGIKGVKENGTSGNYAGALSFQTRSNGSDPAERFRIASDGAITANGGSFTLSNSTTNIVVLSGSTSNRIDFGTGGQAAPAASSAGMKIKLYGASGVMATSDYAIGVESSYVWHNVVSAGGFKWYAATTLFGVFTTDGLATSGRLALNTTTPASSGAFVQAPTIAITGIANAVQETIKAFSTQTANITEWQDSSSNVLARITGTGEYEGRYLKWTTITGTSQSASVNNAYITNNAGLVTVTLPTSATVGDRIEVVGKGAGGWRVAQNASQTIYFSSSSTTAGVTGRLDSTHQRDSIEIVCITANNDWQVIKAVGNITVT